MLATALLLACAQAPPTPPTPRPTVTLAPGPPWRVVEEGADTVALRLGDGPDGVRIQLVRAAGRHPGLSPIRDGRTLEIVDGHDAWPLARVGWPDERVTAVEVASEGPDLVVRFSGPLLPELTDHPDAPGDPAVAWIRVRPRDDDWRVAATGLAEIVLPGGDVITTATGVESWAVATRWGEIPVDTNAPRTASRLDATAWRLSTWPSLSVQQPYPRVGLSVGRAR